MTDNEFENIRPYTDKETVEALKRISNSPLLPLVSKFFFPKKPFNTLHMLLGSVGSTDEFQQVVMSRLVVAALKRSSSGFTYEGLENLGGDKTFLAISNHRDIILDPALVQWTLFHNNMKMTEICVGSNLLEGNKLVSDLLRSNRMIKVIRGISARELYLSSQLLSKYIRKTITEGRSSVWIAQREGRTKNGYDTTEQGLLKMFDMSGEGNFSENFKELNIIPMSISYEYEPCDFRKARELLIKRTTGKYTKRRNEDTHSIIAGVRQWKGGIHLAIDKPISEEEILRASLCDKNDRYQSIRQTLDKRIQCGYKLWKTNYMGYDLMKGGNKYAIMYSPSELEEFKAYTEKRLSRVESRLDRKELRKIFWEIYGNPVLAKEEILN